jgi:type II secretory ATPase GspE/PulE/Tfp pilus assembly ATPase PilB-like protein
LVRKLCPFCKISFEGIQELMETYEAKYLSQKVQTLYKSNGCRRCRIGYLGRTVVAEVLLIDPEIKELIGRNALGEIYSLLRQKGTYKTMVDDVRSLIFKGETSIEEAVRVLG